MRHCLFLFLAFFAADVVSAEHPYAGAEACKSCHQAEYRAWQASDHFQSMQLATEDYVLGDFNDIQVEFHGVKSRLFREDGRYRIETTGETDRRTFDIAYTFGYRPLQQYLVRLDNNQVQALNIAWDSRPEPEGGQRWFHLREELETDSLFHWTRYFQNWNSQCADCHSTGVEKMIDPKTYRAEVSYEEINVSCEACHGPLRMHVERAGEGQLAPTKVRQGLAWYRDQGQSVARATGVQDDSFIDTCGGCHSLRQVIGESPHYHERYDISLINNVLYELDGGIKEEVFVLGSFMQSKMFAAGVTCMDCHDPHSGKVKFDDNRLCTQCHAPEPHQLPHKISKLPQSDVSCVNCHMPASTYMGVDERRDHAFSVARPSDPHSFVALNTVLQTMDPMRLPDLIGYVEDESAPVIRRASMLARLPVADLSIRSALKLLDHEEPLIRQSAARLLMSGPPVVARMLINDLAADDARLVRMEAAQGLSVMMSQLGDDEAATVLKLISEYRESLSLTMNMPATQVRLGMLAMALGNGESAAHHFEAALRIEPHFLPARLNYAEFLRRAGRIEEARSHFETALEIAPDSVDARHSYGLMLIREGRVEDALEHLKAASEGEGAGPRYAYVYAIGLDSLGRTDEAVQVLIAASARWPNQQELHSLEDRYRAKTGRE